METIEPVIEMQPASIDVWEQKYQLKDKNGKVVDATIDDTFKRVARALADVEPEKKDFWYDEFLWAMRHGAIPAGRILSNAGAQDYKPSTSLINCTVSDTVQDSMDSILSKLHEAGMTLRNGSGIGYCFSTIRPRGAYVNGAGAHTSGPLSFMDIYDKMCFTVSSAGGRRGAQMATFDVGHPDVLEFIRAKREDGRLRQFNLSLLVTDSFMEAVIHNLDWPLAFPLTPKEANQDNIDIYDSSKVLWRSWPTTEGYIDNDEGKVACRIYRTIKAQKLWDEIMRSTYDYAEPGIIFIDEVNKMNNNYWCEHITSTNPCVTADTRLHTQYGMIPIGELYESQLPLEVTVDRRALGLTGIRGVESRPAVNAFMTSESAEVFCVITKEGYEIKATDWHDFYTTRGKIKLKDLQIGDSLLIQSGKGQFGQQGSYELGRLIGLIAGDGCISNNSKNQDKAIIGLWQGNKELSDDVSSYVNQLIETKSLTNRCYKVSPVEIHKCDMVRVSSVILARILDDEYGFNAQTKLKVPEVVWRGNEDCVKGYLSGLFQTDGSVNVNDRSQTCSIRLSSSHRNLLKEVQILLANFGIMGKIYHRRKAQTRELPDGKGGYKPYFCQDCYDIIIDGQSRERFMNEIGFCTEDRALPYRKWAEGKLLRKTQPFTAKVTEIRSIGKQPVFDTTQKDHNTVIFNGIVTGQCGEVPLPSYGCCLLGSIDLTKFVVNPFSDGAYFDGAYFDFGPFKSVVAIFSRMLDNVVEINGLPLEQQRNELTRKRRHGMGYMGLGSALTMMKIKYGSPEAIKFTEELTFTMAHVGFRQGVELAKKKGPAPIMHEMFLKTPKEFGKNLFCRSNYMKKLEAKDADLVHKLETYGSRYTHATSIAPCGTLALSVGNNISNGIEPSFAHQYSRNIIKEGKKTKEKVDVYSYEFLAYKTLVDPNATVDTLPDYFVTADSITPEQHVDMQAAAQKWIDQSISKTVNCPTDYPFEKFKNLYMYAYEKGVKGLATFRFNPTRFQGVLVRNEDLTNTTYQFTLADGSTVKAAGNEQIDYDGEIHTAANLFDAIKEGLYGKF